MTGTPLEAALRDMAVVTTTIAGLPAGERDAHWWRLVRQRICAVHGIPSLSLLDQPPRTPKEKPVLSKKQHAVLQLLAQGLTASETALRLGVSYQTVKTHIARLLRDLGARNTAHAVAIALRENLIE